MHRVPVVRFHTHVLYENVSDMPKSCNTLLNFLSLHDYWVLFPCRLTPQFHLPPSTPRIGGLTFSTFRLLASPESPLVCQNLLHTAPQKLQGLLYHYCLPHSTGRGCPQSSSWIHSPHLDERAGGHYWQGLAQACLKISGNCFMTQDCSGVVFGFLAL